MSDSTIIGLFILLEIPWMILLIKTQTYPSRLQSEQKGVY